MEARKVNGQPLIRVITFYPDTIGPICNSFPGVYVIRTWEEPNSGDLPNNFFIWVRCPNEEVATKLGNLLRSIPADDVVNEEERKV